MRAKKLKWTKSKYTGSNGSVGGSALFSVGWGTRRSDTMWTLSTSLPIYSPHLGQHYYTEADAQKRAQDLLDEFVEGLSE